MLLPRTSRSFGWLLVAAAILLVAPTSAMRADEPKLTKEQMKQFLLTAKVTASKEIGKGITRPYRLTLTDGAVTHDAAFQAIDEKKTQMQFATGGTELNFRDSYHFNLAAYHVAELLKLDGMMPVTVERKWEGKTGALSWWIPWKWDEGMRLKQNIKPPDPEAWNNQMHRMRVFSQLVYDTDRNLGNVLITEDWHLWMIDFTRAFRMRKELESEKNITKCDRDLLARLRTLDYASVEAAVKPHLSKDEIETMLIRRDKILAHVASLVSTQGEKNILY